MRESAPIRSIPQLAEMHTDGNFKSTTPTCFGSFNLRSQVKAATRGIKRKKERKKERDINLFA
jgi:hypothetical protein